MPGSLQSLAGVLSLLVALSVAVLLWLLLRRIRPERPAEAAVHAVYRTRAAYFWALLAGLAVALALTLGRLPYAAGETPAPDQVVKVLGRQWSWTFDVGDGEQASVTLPVDRVVEFRVTAADVNHGFSLYDAEGRLLAQTQAMPGYVNRLRHRFTRPGTYYVLCLEYCGLLHQNMIAELHVE